MPIYSLYDEIAKQHSILFKTRLFFLSIISIIFTVILYFLIHIKLIGYGLFIYPIIFLVFILINDNILKIIFSNYRIRRKKEFELVDKIEKLKQKINETINSFKKREKGQQFKKAYNFIGYDICKFENNLAFAMLLEKKEVWVVALCKKNTVVKVLATIGSVHSCKPSADLKKIKEYAKNNDCDEIRHYHNHPIYKNRTEPSPPDIAFNKNYCDYLLEMKDIFKTFIIFWNAIYEYRILEYFDNGKSKIYYFFDISKNECY